MARKGLGCNPDERDIRDREFAYKAHPELLKALPFAVDLRAAMPPIYDQGSLGSCTAQAVCAVLQYSEKELVKGKKRPIPSRLFHYYNTRILQGTVKEDSGASIRNAVKAAAQWGYCNENLWAHKISMFDTKPNAAAYDAADDHMLTVAMYQRVDRNLAQIKAAIAAHDPVIIGFSVYDNFSQAGKTGIMPMPTSKNELQGGHAAVIVGYNDETERAICRNSWGTKWGQSGYFEMPFKVLMDNALSRDFWLIKTVPANIEVVAA